ncbi:MAG: 4-hydroxy-tetrahydrodipicolinate synthase [Elusimicrobiota bacterium]
MFKGSYVALVTPFKNGRVDETRLKALVEYHIDAHSDGLVPCGSTGESATLTHEEHRHVVEVVVKTARGRLPVIAGAGSNSTAETLELVRHAHKVGAQGALVVVPYYNKPTARGLYEHFRIVAKATPLPIILYNIPGRSVVNVTPETVIQLAKDCPTIVGIKEASGTMDYTSQLVSALGTDRFLILSGDDSLTIPLMALGAKGVISVIANILPGAMAELCRAWSHGHTDRALDIHKKMFPLMRSLFIETNPIPIKAAMAHLGLCREELRMPLVPMSPDNKRKLVAALKACPLLEWP